MFRYGYGTSHVAEHTSSIASASSLNYLGKTKQTGVMF